VQKIIPHLWFDKEAKEAAEFYASVFPSSKVSNVTKLRDTPSGDCDLVSFELWGHDFMAISAGPLFKINPSISFMVNFDPSREKNAKEQLDAIWERLSEGGTALMPLDKYPFSERFGWIQDRYGVSWQLILTNPDGEPRPTIMPFLMFVGGNCGKAEEAVNFYLSVFKNSKQGKLMRYGANQLPDREGTIQFTDFMIENKWFVAIESAHNHQFAFNEAVSLIVHCDTQQEIDYYSEKLSAVPEAEQCGWLKDKYGLSWQITPSVMGQMLSSKDQKAVDRVVKAFLQMKRFDIEKLKRAFAG
jgi:predicted 3-demethylubiquinone-9 3-methyltransferase (glyoxalase superfamily)